MPVILPPPTPRLPDRPALTDLIDDYIKSKPGLENGDMRYGYLCSALASVLTQWTAGFRAELLDFQAQRAPLE